MSKTLLIGSTNVVELVGLHDRLTGTYPTNATVVLDLLTPAGESVAGATGIAMPHVPGTSGAASIYRGTIPHSLALAPGDYVERVTATDAEGNVRAFRESITARTR